ncbi:hypothetical protein OAE19_00495 [Porticoccaceae bacterium]|nr:hypothetical protein [Porticoccaceae bacterium]
MGFIAKYSWKAAKGGIAVTTGIIKGVYSVGGDTKNLLFGNSEILHLQQKLRLKNSDYQAKRSKMSDKYPYIDSAVLSGLSLADMLANGVPTDVSKAYELAFSEKFGTMPFTEAWQSYDTHEERLGFISAMKGKLFEVKYVDHLNDSLEAGYSAQIAQSPTQAGWDIEVLGPNQEVINQIQLKATTSAAYVRDAIEQYPYIDVVTLEDLKGHFALTEYSSEVTVSAFSNQDLTEELMGAVDFNMGSLPPLIAMGFIVFSAYREKDLTPYQRHSSIGERGTRFGINGGILMFTGLAGIPVVFTKEYLLKKGRQRKEVIKDLKLQLAMQKASYKSWNKRVSRRQFLTRLTGGALPS